MEGKQSKEKLYRRHFGREEIIVLVFHDLS